MEDFFVQECCVHGTDLENHGPTSILCDDPLPIESNAQAIAEGGGFRFYKRDAQLSVLELPIIVCV